MSGRKWHYRRYLPGLIGAVVVLSIGGSVAWLIADFLASEPGAPKKQVQEITLLAPPPPPPPPPRMDEPPPEPEIEEEVEVPEPETLDELPDAGDEPPPGDALGLDAEGGAGSDGFGLVGRKGGRSLLSGGHAWYAKDLGEGVHENLYQYKELRSQAYSIIVNLWIDDKGHITDAEIQKGSGRETLDDTIKDALLKITLAKAPPEGMPQPVRVRINSRL